MKNMPYLLNDLHPNLLEIKTLIVKVSKSLSIKNIENQHYLLYVSESTIYSFKNRKFGQNQTCENEEPNSLSPVGAFIFFISLESR